MRHRAVAAIAAVACVAAGAAEGGVTSGSAAAWPRGTAVVSYTDEAVLRRALAAHPARVVRKLVPLRVVELRPFGDVERYATALDALDGIDVERRLPRLPRDEPALVRAPGAEPLQWQYAAAGFDRVPQEVLRAAAGVTIAVVDTGADVTTPDLAAKRPSTWSVRTRSPRVADRNGHGTFVASLAAGSVANGEGIAGSGGDAQLVVVQASGADGAFSDVDEAAAIVWAVDNGARVLNLSLGGPGTSTVERRAVEYAIGKGALLVAAVGNSFLEGNPVEFPAALLQPRGTNGAGGAGLAVAASTRRGERAFFSNTGSHLSLAAPGEQVFAAVASTSRPARYPRVALPGALAGVYGYGSGTSYAAPQVAGAAALVWAANPALTAAEVATILEQTASGGGSWNPQLGYGVVDAAAAVARARETTAPGVRIQGTRAGRRVTLAWPGVAGAAAFRVSVAQDGRAEQVLTPATTETSVSYSLSLGSVYRFTVAALDESGAATSVSAPWSVSLRQAGAKLVLSASPRAGRALQPVALTAALRVASRAAPMGGRRLVLEARGAGGWSRADTAATDVEGRAVWRFELERGTYRLRARFAGAEDVGGAVSAPVVVTIR